MSFRKRALFLAGLLAAVSCSDAGNPVGPGPEPGPGGRPIDNALQALDCSLSLESGSLRCTGAQPGTGDASGLILGGQNLYVTLAGSNIQRSGNTVSLDVTVRNLIPQTLGIDSTGATDADSVQVFFHELRDAAGAGIVQTDNDDGEYKSFDGQMRPFFRYEPLAPGQTSAPQTWTLSHAAGVTNITMKLYVAAKVKHPQGWVDITPNSALLGVGQSATLADTVRDRVGVGITDDVTWSSSDPSIVTVTETSDSTAQIQGISQGSAWIRAQSIAASVRKDSILVTVNNAPVLNLDSISAISNVTMPVDSAHGMLANDSDDEKLTVSAGAVTTDQGGTATLAANGSFSYLSKAGFAGLDTIRYTVTDGARTLPGKAVVKVGASNYWFVEAGATGDGRDSSPFGTLAAAQASAAAGDTLIVLVNDDADPLLGAVTLKPNQALIGAGTSDTIAVTLNDTTVYVLLPDAAPELINTALGATITLDTNNVIRGVGITAANGAAITGSGFGTLFVRETGVNPAGPALHLTTGTLDAVFSLLSSTGSATEGLYLNGVAGSLAGMGQVQNAAGTAIEVDGGSADLALAVQVTNTAGLAVRAANRSAGALTLSSSITDSGNGISVTGNTGGSIELSGALSLTGSGVSVGGNTGGTISFNGTSKTISTGANAGVSLTGNTGAAVQFGGGGLAVSTTSGAGFTATAGGTVSVTGGGNTVASTTGTTVTLNAVGTGADGVSFASVSANGAPNGIVLSGVTGAGLQVTGVGAAAGSGGTVQNTTSHAVSLGSMTGADSVNLKHMTVNGGNAGTAGIFGSDFGTLRVTDLSVSATGGPALSLASGTLNGGFSSLGSASSASGGVILTSVGGSFTAAAGTITGAASTAFAVVGGSVSATIAGSISQASAFPVVAVSGSHNGALTFETGTLSANNGTGLQFNAAAGTYAFNGTTTLNGGDAGIDITNGSTGSFTFGTGASVTSPTGSAFTAYGSSPTVVYNGNLTKANAGLLVDIGEVTGGTVTFQTGTLSATAGLGISLSNADGAVAFNGTTTLNGGDAGVDVVSGSGGAISFGTGASITNPTGTALNVSNGGAATNLAYAGSISANAGPPVSVTGVSGGTVTVSGNITSTAQGITVASNTGGAITFSGASKSLSTGVNTAVLASTNAGATVLFSGGGLAITTTTGAGISATVSGTFSVTGANNTVLTGTGTPVSMANVGTGVGGVSLAGTSSTGSVNGISLTNVTGAGVQSLGGTIANTTGAAVLISGGTVPVNLGTTLNQAANAPLVSVSNAHSGAVEFTGTQTATHGTGLQFDNADGSYAFNGTVNLANGVVGADAGIDVLNGSGGTFSFNANAAVTNPANQLVTISASAPAFTYAGSFTKNNNSVTAIQVQNNTGGTIAFTGDAASETKVLSTGAAAAVNLSSNTGATVNFSGGSLAITTTSGAGFTATGGGTVNVTGSANTVSSGTGTAVNVENTTVGGSGMEFRSVSANGATNGIVLNNTGNTGGLFSVQGTGSAGSGGTIQNTRTGASFTSANHIRLNWMNFASANTSDGAGTCDGLDNSGCTGGVKLTTVSDVLLDRLAFSGTIAQEGIVGSTVTGITISNATITNAGNEQWEHGIKLFDVLGTANSITGTTVTNAGNFNIFVQNSTSTNGVAGASDSLRIASNTISNPGSSLQSDGITVATRSTGNLKVVVDANTFNTVRAATDGVQVDAGGSSKVVAVVTGNSIVGYNTAVNISGASNATNLFTVQNNPTLSSVAGATVNLASNGLSILRGTVKGNANMTTTSTNNSTTGIDAIVDAGGVIVADIDSNVITGKYLAGIRGGARNAFNPGDADFTIRNNTITAQTGTTTAFAGLYMVAGNGSPGETNRTCVNLSNNQIVSQAPGAFDYDIYLESYNGGGFNNTFQIQGLTGSGSTPANVHAYVSSKDIGGARVQGFFTTGAETYTAATCATP